MKKKNTKGLVVFGLLALCVILTAGLFMLGQGPKAGIDVLPQNTDNLAGGVTPGGIVGTPFDTPPTIRPGVISPTEPPVGNGTDNDIPLTVIEDRPEPPELPATAYTGEPTGEATPDDVEAHQALDPSLTNPDVKPNITPPPVTPARPNDNTPQGGTTNDKGEVYVPGFGWIPNSGANDGKPSGSDGDWDKQIGNMG